MPTTTSAETPQAQSTDVNQQITEHRNQLVIDIGMTFLIAAMGVASVASGGIVDVALGVGLTALSGVFGRMVADQYRELKQLTRRKLCLERQQFESPSRQRLKGPNPS
jgi:hypothetical protein